MYAIRSYYDPEGVWRGFANAALAGDYQTLFGLCDRLVLLAAPGWEVVSRWREQQEAELRESGGTAVMTPAAVRRFIRHYERLTRHILTEMPARADLDALGSAPTPPAPHVALVRRITSYNVCYTKLLRTARSKRSTAPPGWRRRPKEPGKH